MSGKPAVFFSHSSADKAQLVRLKELFVRKTGGTIDVFLSSDGQSIPLGANWVHSLQDALENAKVMFVFVSPSSLHSSWLYFESGFSYSKKIRVVPIGYKGVDLSSIPPPLSLLQGFNIESEAGLDNLIAIANDAFSHSHALTFTDAEYREACLSGAGRPRQALGKFGHLAEEITCGIGQSELNLSPPDALLRMQEMLSAGGIAAHVEKETLAFPGVLVTADGEPRYSPGGVRFAVEPMLADTALPTLAKIISDIRKDGLTGQTLTLKFNPSVDCLEQSHKLSGRVFGTAANMIGTTTFVLGDLECKPSHQLRWRGGERAPERGNASMHIRARTESLAVEQVRAVLDFAFDTEIYFVRDFFPFDD